MMMSGISAGDQKVISSGFVDECYSDGVERCALKASKVVCDYKGVKAAVRVPSARCAVLVRAAWRSNRA